MSDPSDRPPSGIQPPRDEDQRIPLVQRLSERPLLLLLLSNVVMFAFFTVWGIVEMFSLPPAPLP